MKRGTAVTFSRAEIKALIGFLTNPYNHIARTLPVLSATAKLQRAGESK